MPLTNKKTGKRLPDQDWINGLLAGLERMRFMRENRGMKGVPSADDELIDALEQYLARLGQIVKPAYRNLEDLEKKALERDTYALNAIPVIRKLINAIADLGAASVCIPGSKQFEEIMATRPTPWNQDNDPEDEI